MRTLIKIILLISIFSSCGGGDDCTSDSYIGIWDGTFDCENSSSEIATFEIRQGAGADEIIVNTGTAEYSALIDGCKLIIPEQNIFSIGIEIKISGEGVLEDNGTLIFVLDQKVLGLVETCTVSLTQ